MKKICSLRSLQSLSLSRNFQRITENAGSLYTQKRPLSTHHNQPAESNNSFEIHLNIILPSTLRFSRSPTKFHRILLNCTSALIRGGQHKPHRFALCSFLNIPRTFFAYKQIFSLAFCFQIQYNSTYPDAGYPDRHGPSGTFVKNSTELTCHEITGYRIKHSTVLWLIQRQIRSGRNV